MDALTAGADIATMATGLAAVTAAVAWIGRQWDGWRSDRAARQRRNWHGYIDVGGINTWNARLAEPPKTSGAIVTVEVIRPDGTPDEQMASAMRIVIERDGFLARAPTVSELEFLTYLRKNDGYGQRNLVVR
jgi:hypothetical protein